ncbi:diguanylate phosphodiesterase [Methylobacterium sp. Leaf104]|uniref:bifunctional diguanylate cyclase/phosphodiesterase n=1 Tax=Methylobacterium TaxID=407 RepID=UPI0006F2203E|nr:MULTISPECIES: EAL domain-containing protein [Methylobacterium]KQP42625.1 diguanylate phosphodiesterase [Methylobacterium sp. Leaf104]MCI9878815.1 EAL domain-containing protein [Methylobacterium goesingense]
MLTVMGCFLAENDPWLMALAGIICILAATSTIALLHHARQTRVGWRGGWVAVAAVAGGSGIWATHFLSMLAFDPGLVAAYAVGLTVLSLVLAILVSGAGLATAVFWGARGAPLAGGAIVGLGIAAMHYTGMAAYQVAGRMDWHPGLVALSIVAGIGLAMAALGVGLTSRRTPGRIVGAALLAAAIWAHHVLGMTALTMVPDPRVLVPEETVPPLWLALPVGLASLTILVMACTALVLDLRERQRAVYRGRLLSLANAAVEGLVICQDGVIVSANDSFAALTGTEARSLDGVPLSRFIPDAGTLRSLEAGRDEAVEGTLYRLDGAGLPVELIMRPVAYGRTPHVALAVRDLTARRRAERQIQFLVGHDPLTGLPNRQHFHSGLDQGLRRAAASGGRLALLHINLDGFKEINDLFGNAIGDGSLVRVARLLGGLLDPTQMVARIGGDEFAVLTPCSHAVAAGRLAEEIRATLQAAAESAAQGEPVPAATIGIAVFPDDARDRNDLLNAADTALLLAKAEGRGSYRFFEASVGQDVRERRLLEKQLRRALAEDQLRLVYQPQIETRTGAVLGFEVLLRWHQPARGFVSPAVFIPIAEESGLIREIGAWVLREACQEAARWEAPLSVAVNVSGVQVHDAGFAPAVRVILAETGLDPARLELEITETALIRDPDRARTNLRQLKALGLRIAMDDFGTGYSSLSNLRMFPFDTIKIDGSFIAAVDSNPQAAAIVRSVLGLGAGLGLPVIAEGVETAEELAFLVAEKCHAAQGYFIGRPGPIGGFEQHTGRARRRSPVAA